MKLLRYPASEGLLSFCYVLSIVSGTPWVSVWSKTASLWRMVGFRERERNRAFHDAKERISVLEMECAFSDQGRVKQWRNLKVKQIVFALCVVYKSVLCRLHLPHQQTDSLPPCHLGSSTERDIHPEKRPFISWTEKCMASRHKQAGPPTFLLHGALCNWLYSKHKLQWNSMENKTRVDLS